jgi:hypothetical protein
MGRPRDERSWGIDRGGVGEMGHDACGLMEKPIICGHR